MLEIIVGILCVWLILKSLKLAFKAAWGAAKIVASLLFGVAIPLLFYCVIFVGGIVVLIPLALIAIAFGILKFLL